MKIVWAFCGYNIPTKLAFSYDIRYANDINQIGPCEMVVVLDLQCPQQPRYVDLLFGNAFCKDGEHNKTNIHISTVVDSLLKELTRNDSIDFINNSNVLELYTKKMIVAYSNVACYPSTENYDFKCRNYTPILPIYMSDFHILNEDYIINAIDKDYIKDNELVVFISEKEYNKIRRSECKYYAEINNKIITIYDREDNNYPIKDKKLNYNNDNLNNIINMGQLLLELIEFINSIDYTIAPQ